MKTFKHIRTGKLYAVISMVMMKNNQTRAWEKAFIYSAWGKEDRLEKEIYVREEKDFNQRFVEFNDFDKDEQHLGESPNGK